MEELETIMKKDEWELSEIEFCIYQTCKLGLVATASQAAFDLAEMTKKLEVANAKP